MNEQLRRAYFEHLDTLARSGVIDHALDNAILEGKTVEESIVEILRTAGRLPEGWDSEHDQEDLAGDRHRRAG